MTKRFDTVAVNPELAARRLEAVESLRTPSTKRQGDFYINLRCPLCGKIKASVHADNPGRLYCWSGSCAASKNEGGVSVDDHFGITIDYEKSFPPSAQDRNAPATAYLTQQRCLSPDVLQGVDYFYQPSMRGSGHGGVVLRAGIDSAGKQILNGRFIGTIPLDGGKTHTQGHIGELVDIHFGKEIDTTSEVFVVEGWITALSLEDMGEQSVWVGSAMANLETRRDIFGRCEKLVLMYDDDASGAGQRALRRGLEQFPQASAMLMERGTDANDLLRRFGKEKAANVFNKNRDRYSHNARLVLADTPVEYSDEYWQFHRSPAGIFFHDGSCWHAALARRKGEEEPVPVVRQVGEFTTFPKSFQREADGDDARFSFRLEVHPKGRQPLSITARPHDLVNALSWRLLLLDQARVAFTGTNDAAVALTQFITNTKNIPEVRIAPKDGLDLDTDWYITQYFAVDQKGVVHRPDRKNGWYKTSGTGFTAPVVLSSNRVRPSNNVGNLSTIYELLHRAYGPKGLLAFGWVVASWFSTPIRNKLHFFPLLSIFGEKQSGKTSYLMLLQQMQGFVGVEGIQPHDLHTRIGIGRGLGQLSNLFTAIIESQFDPKSPKKTSFHPDILYGLYNDGSDIQKRGVKSNDTRTDAITFDSSLLLAANTENILYTPALRERAISIEFRPDSLTQSSRAAHQQLAQISPDELATVSMLTWSKRIEIETRWHESFLDACNALNRIDNVRVRENYAVALGLHNMFAGAHGLKHLDIAAFTEQAATKKMRTVVERPQDLSDFFFEAVLDLPPDKTERFLHLDKENHLLFVHLPGAVSTLRNANHQFAIDRLMDCFRHHEALVESGKVFRFPHDPDRQSDGRPPSKKTWVFDDTKL